MRDPNRLYGFYDEIRRIHMEKFPDWRFGQFMSNFTAWLRTKKFIGDIFYPEDEEMLKFLKEYVGEK